jgi:hypothetical protein
MAPHAFSEEYWENAPHRPAVWTVEDGAIVGRQDEPGSGFGGFLVTEQKYGDYELVLEANPDWPADTGIILRKEWDGFGGIQVLVDYRQSGSIGGFYGNGIGGWHAVSYAFDGVVDQGGKLLSLKEDDPVTSIEPVGDKAELLTYGIGVDDFLSTWRVNDWNEIRVRIVGAKPIVTTWINGLKTAEIDLAALKAPNYEADQVAEFLGRASHIGLEVHDSDPMMKQGRWGIGNACRWRNLRIKELS